MSPATRREPAINLVDNGTTVIGVRRPVRHGPVTATMQLAHGPHTAASIECNTATIEPNAAGQADQADQAEETR